ncbi:MAG: ECF transporter S component [Tissierellia bacterium]|nr:ECF transporter S component [Tissierellia bacterium]
MKTRKLAITGLLTALAIVIPFAVFFKIIIPPFSATLGAHVPMFISMLLGPEVAIMTGIGSALGFFLNLGPLIGARAFMHVFVGLLGGLLIKKGWSFSKTVIVTGPLHGLLEVLIVMPFIGFNVYDLLLITGVGTFLHHLADGFISYVIVKFLHKARVFNFTNIKHNQL